MAYTIIDIPSFDGSYDTVLPGETSPTFDTFGPKTRKHEDIEILHVLISAVAENGKTMRITYDTKLKRYSYTEY